MAKEPFDHWIKTRLGDGDFPYKESYWADMESLIEKRRKRRRFPWLWLLLLVGVASVGLWWAVDHPSNTTSPTDIPTQQQGLMTSTEPSEGVEESQASSSPATSINEPQSAAPTAADTRTDLSKPITNTVTIEPSISSTPSVVVVQPIIPEDRPTYEPLGANAHTQEAGSTGTTNEAKELAVINPEREERVALLFGSVTPITFTSVSSIYADPIVEAPAIDRAYVRRITPRHRMPAFDYRSSLSVSAFNGPIDHGFEVGLTYRMPIGKKWYAYAGSAYELWTASDIFTEAKNVSSFSFGREESSVRLAVEQIHALHLRTGLEYSLDRHHMQVGLYVNRVIAARGGKAVPVEESTSVGDPGTFEVRSKTTWVQTHGINDWNVGLSASYGFDVHRRWNIAVVGRYVVNGVFDKNTLNMQGGVVKTDKQPYGGVRLSFHLF